MDAYNGGPAFPGEKATRFGQANDCNEGMTLRDYFAAKAMQAILTRRADIGMTLAKDAYIYADAMIAARETK